jgi:hypothetical protein
MGWDEIAEAWQETKKKLKSAKKTITTLIEEMGSYKESMKAEMKQYEELLLAELNDVQEELEAKERAYETDKRETISLLTDMQNELDRLAGACNERCGVWRVACGVWRVACGVWRVACGVWRVACGVCLRARTDALSQIRTTCSAQGFRIHLMTAASSWTTFGSSLDNCSACWG